MMVSFIGGRNLSTCRKLLTNFITECCIEYMHLTCAGFELTTLVVIGTDCTGSWKANHHTITATTTPIVVVEVDTKENRFIINSRFVLLGNTISLNLY